MRRREFLIRSATAAGVAWLSSKSIFKALAEQTLPKKFAAYDTVTLGNTGIKTSRLAMGTGTVGSGHHSHQTALGVKDSPLSCSTDTITACASSTPPTPTEAILMSPRRSSMCRATKSPCSRKLWRATPPAPAPISTASAANSAPTISTSA